VSGPGRFNFFPLENQVQLRSGPLGLHVLDRLPFAIFEAEMSPNQACYSKSLIVTSKASSPNMGLQSPTRYARVLDLIGRRARASTRCSGIFSAMWKRALASYKSLQGGICAGLPDDGGALRHPGSGLAERRRWIDIGRPGLACRPSRLESHNHPSYIEPYQGARDQASAGSPLRDRLLHHWARGPIACLNALLVSGIPRASQDPPIWCPAWSPASAGYGQFPSGRADGRRLRALSTAAMTAQTASSNAMARSVSAETDKFFLLPAASGGSACPIVYLGLQDRPRRASTAPPWRSRRIRARNSEEKAADRPGRRPLLGKKAAAGKPAWRSWPKAASSRSRNMGAAGLNLARRWEDGDAKELNSRRHPRPRTGVPCRENRHVGL